MLFTFPFSQVHGQSPADDCELSWTHEAPFYISRVTDVRSDRWSFGRTDKAPPGMERDEAMTTERLRDLENRRVFKPIFRGTIVRLLSERDGDLHREMIERGEGALIPVEVVSENDTYAPLKPGNEKQNYARRGDLGRLWSESMRAVEKSDRFIVTGDTLFQDVAGLPVSFRNMALRPVMNRSGEYQIDCRGNYIFRAALNSNPDVLPSVTFALNACTQDLGLRHLSEENLENLLQLREVLDSRYGQKLGLADFEFNDWGLVRLPMQRISNRPGVIGEALDGSFIRYPTNTPEGSNDWIHPQAACSILDLSSRFREKCLEVYVNKDACSLQVGNTSFITPALSSARSSQKLEVSLDIMGHQTHYQGTCVDIRPPATRSWVGGVRRGVAPYSLTLTRFLVEIAHEMGASPIYFSDDRVSRLPYVSDPGDHDDHLHLCFHNTDVRNSSCERLFGDRL